MGKVYKTWRDFPLGDWRWPNFSPQELASKREGELMIDPDAMDKLQKLRNVLGKPMLITSAYRSEAHNRAVGGAKNSQHRLAKAFDVVMTNQDPHAFVEAAKAVGFKGIGYYPKQNFIHIDTGPARTWGDPWPKKNAATPNFPTEPKRETITDIVTKPEVLTGAGAVLTGAGAVSQGSGPVQFALAIVMVVIVVAFAAFLITRALQRPRDV